MFPPVHRKCDLGLKGTCFNFIEFVSYVFVAGLRDLASKCGSRVTSQAKEPMRGFQALAAGSSLAVLIFTWWQRKAIVDF